VADAPLTPDVVILGAGVAGLSAATTLAEAGRRVLVLEEAPRLGGRATAFTDRTTGERVDNGQHVFFGCYRETYAFLERTGVADRAPLQRTLSLTMAGPAGRLHRLHCPPLRPPWHLIAGVLKWDALGWRDRLSIARIGTIVTRARREGAAALAASVPPEQTVDDWLRARGQTERLCEWLWRPLAIAALNQSTEVASAASFVRVVAELFGPRPVDAAIGLATVPLDDLFGVPAVRYLERRGSAVRVRTPGAIVLDDRRRVGAVHTSEGIVPTKAVISTVPWYAFGRIWQAGMPSELADVGSAAASMESSPIVTVNLWFESGILPAPFVGFVNGPMHWAFDKSAIFGEHAGHLSVVASGAGDLIDRTNQAITDLVVKQLITTLPAAPFSKLLRSVVIRERRASFSVAPGAPARPGARTPIAGFYLAGDWTDTGLPATLEGAALSGHRAAAALLSAGSDG
jgi:squalene-associated FAD-dependent desaturase